MSPTIQKTTEQVVASNFKIGVSIVSSSSIIKFKIWLIANAYIDVRRLIRNTKMHRVAKCIQASYQKILLVLSVKLKKFGVANSVKES
jgi:hypothetical protein